MMFLLRLTSPWLAHFPITLIGGHFFLFLLVFAIGTSIFAMGLVNALLGVRIRRATSVSPGQAAYREAAPRDEQLDAPWRYAYLRGGVGGLAAALLHAAHPEATDARVQALVRELWIGMPPEEARRITGDYARRLAVELHETLLRDGLVPTLWARRAACIAAVLAYMPLAAIATLRIFRLMVIEMVTFSTAFVPGAILLFAALLAFRLARSTAQRLRTPRGDAALAAVNLTLTA
jgi:hypothetical protein